MITHGNLDFELTVALATLSDLFTPEGAPDDPASARPRRRVPPSATSTAPGDVLFLPMAHVFARIIQVGAMRARVRLGHSADVRRLVNRLEEFRRASCSRCPDLREDLQHRLAAGAGRRTRCHLHPGRRHRHRVVARPRRRTRAGPAAAAPPALRRWSTRDCGARWAVAAATPSRAGRRSATGSDTSTAGSGSPSSRATASPKNRRGDGQRPRRPQAGHGRTPPARHRRPGGRRRRVLAPAGRRFPGYWGDDEATAAVLDEHGWLRTGDVGEIDDEGFVRITGRKKEILVTAGGKNVAPAVLEDRLRAHPLVDQALVVGDGRPFVAALVTLDPRRCRAGPSSTASPTDRRSSATTPTSARRSGGVETTPTPRSPGPRRSAPSRCSRRP